MIKIPYEYLAENVNSVQFAVKEYAGVGKINILTQNLILESKPGLEISNLFFNPSEKKITINYSSGKTRETAVSVYTLEGKKILLEYLYFDVGRHTHILQPFAYKPGLHLVVIEYEGHRYSKKIILQ